MVRRHIPFVVFFLAIILSKPLFAANPVTIDDAWVTKNGSVVTGSFEGTSTQPAISVTTRKAITIQGTAVSGPGDLIKISSGANVTIVNTRGTGLNPNVKNKQKGAFVTATSPANLLVKNCTITGTRFGIYVAGYTSGSGTVKILQNIINNTDGRYSDGAGGYIMQGDMRAHAIQLNGVRGAPGVEIAWNQIINVPFQSETNDMVNIYSNGGSSNNHLKIHDNFIQGCLPANPGTDAESGVGIITDGSSSDSATTATSFVDIYNNQLTMMANQGLATAAGHDNNIFNNRVISAGKLSNGTVYATPAGNGAYNWNAQKQSTGTFFNNHVHDNLFGFLRKSSSGGTARSDWWLPGQNFADEGNIHFTPNNNSSPTLQDEANEFASWQKKLAENNIHPGINDDSGTIQIVNSSTSDASCAKAQDQLYVDKVKTGAEFEAGTGTTTTATPGDHEVKLASMTTAVPAVKLSGSCTSTIDDATISVAKNQTTRVTATYKYTIPPATAGIIKLGTTATSDPRCAGASDIFYLDGSQTGVSFAVANGTSLTVQTGSHTFKLASAGPISAGSGESGTCTSTLSTNQATVETEQTVPVYATYVYKPAPSGATCKITSSKVIETPTWGIKVDSFQVNVSVTGFSVDTSGNISMNGSIAMKNAFHQSGFWADQGFTIAYSGSNGTWTGKMYAPNGSASFNLKGNLIDGKPNYFKVGDNPMQSLTISGTQCN
ncbi:MAG: hypothetical protein SFW66_00715 [Gammaproteobacteria bacterium]|nr:hypothetical protein [Gammaproteobacteria bacterium]